MNNIKITICYDGSSFNGWQRQNSTSNTIQQNLEEAIEKAIGEKVKLISSGRTDAGVHALAQTANFKCIKNIEDYKYFVRKVNEYTDDAIKITDAKKTDISFHSRLDAKGKKYSYLICMKEKPPVFERQRIYPYAERLDIEKIKGASLLLCGKHDYRAFSSEKNKDKSTVRQIWDIDISVKNDILNITYFGNGFLYNMVRILTGTLIEIGAGKKQEDDILKCFETNDRKYAGFMAPACGLTLLEVIY